MPIVYHYVVHWIEDSERGLVMALDEKGAMLRIEAQYAFSGYLTVDLYEVDWNDNGLYVFPKG